MSSDELWIAGHTFQPSIVFYTYWRSAAERHMIYLRRLHGYQPPLTGDPIFEKYKFTNVFRAADRVSQFMIHDVISQGSQDPEEVTFRVLLFDMFKRISTWERFMYILRGQLAWQNYDFNSYDDIMYSMKAKREPIFTSAYLMVSRPNFGEATQHGNYLRLIEKMMADKLIFRLQGCRSMEQAYEILHSYPSVGKFLAYQLLIDLNYTNALDFDEDEFVVSGPGCDSGLHKCFGSAAHGFEREILMHMTEYQHYYFSRLGLNPVTLFGRPMKAIDIEHWCCENDKYARAAHPEIRGLGDRTRIKAQFTPATAPVTAWFPPKWGLS